MLAVGRGEGLGWEGQPLVLAGTLGAPGPTGIAGCSSGRKDSVHWGGSGQGLPRGRDPQPQSSLGYASTGQERVGEVTCGLIWSYSVAFDPACLTPGPGPALYLGPAGVQ